jgi:hypothetical protein
VSRGPHRLLHDRGLAILLVALAVVLGGLSLARLGEDRARRSVDRRPGVEGVVRCLERRARGAAAVMRPPLSRPAERVGQPYASVVTEITGTFRLPLPYPVPPGFVAEVLVSAPGCVTHRQVVGAGHPDLDLTLPPVRYVRAPVDLSDGPGSPSFPPPADLEQVRALRDRGLAAAGSPLLHEWGPPACRQCHVSTGHEHDATHGRPPSPLVLLLAALAGEPHGQECARCHAPAAAVARGDLRAVVPAQGGFSCSVCHAYRPAPHGERGDGLGVGGGLFAAVAWDTGRFARGTRPDTASPPMVLERTPELGNSGLCEACHGQTVTAPGGLVVVDPVVEEHRAWAQAQAPGTPTACPACHFPATGDPYLVDGYAREVWGVMRPHAPRRAHGLTGDRGARVASALVLSGRWEGEGTLVVEAHNVGAGHALPGGAPWRRWEVRVVAPRAVTTGPVLEGGQPGVALWRALGGRDRPTCAWPWEATSVVADTRVPPLTPVSWRWSFPGRSPVRVELHQVDACADRLRGLGETGRGETLLRALEVGP